jgi:hypothetical protein
MAKKKGTGKVYAMKILDKASMLSKKKDQFEAEMRQRENELASSSISGLINVDKALYRHWLVASTVRNTPHYPLPGPCGHLTRGGTASLIFPSSCLSPPLALCLAWKQSGIFLSRISCLPTVQWLTFAV